MPLARLRSTQGPYLEATIEMNGVPLIILDEFSVEATNTQNIGAEFNFEFSTQLDENESWESICAGNPDKKIGLVNLVGWQYRAFGKITSINPVVVDCGLLDVEDVVRTSDSRVIGEFVAFTIDRLGGYVHAI
jgi:hypothetical protein